MASEYSNARIVEISNSSSQRAHIVAEAGRRGLHNLEVRTLDKSAFQPFDVFDRVVSVEMFDHMRNWEALLGRLEECLAPNGRVFLHVLCHRRATCAHDTDGPEKWLGRRFFTGGMMPSRDYLHHLDVPLDVEAEWTWSGDHDRRTADAWVENLARGPDEVLRVLAETYGPAEAQRCTAGGGSSSSRAPRCSGSGTATNGWWGTTDRSVAMLRHGPRATT